MNERLNESARLPWLLALRGVLTIAFGVAAFGWPKASFEVLGVLYMAYAGSRGAVSLATAAVCGLGRSARWLQAGSGLVGIVAGVAALAMATVSVPGLMLIMACGETLVGLADILMAARGTMGRAWLLLWAGCLAMGLGLLMFLVPAVEFPAMMMFIGVNTIAVGALLTSMPALSWLARQGRGRRSEAPEGRMQTEEPRPPETMPSHERTP